MSLMSAGSATRLFCCCVVGSAGISCLVQQPDPAITGSQQVLDGAWWPGKA